MKIYNTKTLKKEEFKPITEGEVKMYVCGPTVYDNVHIGNVRPVVVFDTLRRTFEELGYKVKYVSNYTDVDDKIIRRSKELGISEKELTDKMIAAYNDIRHKLNAADLYKTPRVTETMNEIISFIDGLVDKGAAYEKDGDVYFRTSSVADYGSLSNQNLDDLQVGHRIEENDLKDIDILINTTPVGMNSLECPLDYNIRPHKNLIVCDIVYKPHETRLLTWAKNNNLRVVYGINMLINQGLLAYEIWEDIKTNDEDVKEIRKIYFDSLK